MKIRRRQLLFVLTPPLLALCLLGGVAAEKRTYVQPSEVEPYHARVRQMVEDLPFVINGTGAELWTGSRKEVQPAAQKLLRPNIIENRLYKGGPRDDWRRAATLLIVHCKDSRDMLGHYPPVCYPAHGKAELPRAREFRELTVGGATIRFTEYAFSDRSNAEEYRTTVYNFLVAPGVGVVADMDRVKAAAEDYQKRYYGAAQFQVVFHGPMLSDLSRKEHDEIFTTLIRPALPVIKTLSTGGL